MEVILMVLALAFLPIEQIQFRSAVLAGRDFSFDRSEQILSKIKRSDPEYYYYRMINNFYLNNKKETLKYVNLIENSFEPIPKRIEAITPIIKANVILWKNDYDNLEDISREMLKTKNKLNREINREVIGEQKEIVKRLDKLIEDAEDKLKKQESQSTPSNSPVKPAEQSQIMPDSGDGKVDNRKLRVILAEWGSLPPREQAKALQEITKGMSPRHRELTENYFRNIAKVQK